MWFFARALLSRVRPPSVRPFVISRCTTKTAKCKISEIPSQDSPETPVLRRKRYLPVRNSDCIVPNGAPNCVWWPVKWYKASSGSLGDSWASCWQNVEAISNKVAICFTLLLWHCCWYGPGFRRWWKLDESIWRCKGWHDAMRPLAKLLLILVIFQPFVGERYMIWYSLKFEMIVWLCCFNFHTPRNWAGVFGDVEGRIGDVSVRTTQWNRRQWRRISLFCKHHV